MKNNVIEGYFKNNLGNIEEKNHILEEIQIAKAEMEIASSIFDNVRDPLLIEAAIYAEHAAKRRYSYLVKLAKQKGVFASKEFLIENCTSLAIF